MTSCTLLSVSMLSGCEQESVDAQMDALCKKDGGIKVYEKVVLSKNQFSKYGDPLFFSTWNTSGGGYSFVSEYEHIEARRPSLDILTWNHANLSKSTLTIIRKADNKILGTYVSYLRIGGAILPRLGSDPAKSCPLNSSNVSLLRTIFVQSN